MSCKVALVAIALAGACASPAVAESVVGSQPHRTELAGELPPYLECVPYARQISGIAIYGDAHTWWQQAAGRYARGNKPRPGAVMALKPYGAMQLGHVAAVSRVVDSRTVLLRHANWSPINGTRGQIEDNVKAVDVSPANDWSEVRIWYAPQGDLGTTRWPVAGFIYPQKAPASESPPARIVAPRPAVQLSKNAAPRDAIGAIIGSF